jgi:hypothetical protein
MDTPTIPDESNHKILIEDNDPFTDVYTIDLCGEPKQTPIPEFPTAILPAAMIIGFLGAVLLIQRTREN